MNNNFIEVKNLHQDKVLEVVQEFVNLYAKDKDPYALKCSVYEYKNSVIIMGLESYDLFSFCYLTNFTKYPIETHFLGQEPEVTGYLTTGHSRFPKAKWLQVYNTGTVEEADSVIVTSNENKHYFFDFGNYISNCDVSLPLKQEFHLNESLLVKLGDINPAEELINKRREKQPRPWWKIW